MDLQERLTQCRIDKEAIESKEQELLDQIKEKEKRRSPSFGDIVECMYGERVVLYDAIGKLCVFGCSSDGLPVRDTTSLSFYTPTGKNIFKNNLFDLK